VNKTVKIGILAAIIAIPIFLYLFLVIFGVNKHKLKKFHPIDVIKKEIKPGVFKYDTIYHKVKDFTLITHLGDTFSTSSIPDKIYIVDFFFTRCSSICPQMTKQLTRIQERFKKRNDFKILSITIDQNYDTPDVLKSYSKKFNANDSLWLFLTGEKNVIYNLAKNQFFLNVLEDNTLEQEEFIHSDKVVLVDKNRNIRGYYNGTSDEDIERLMIEMDILFYEYSKK
jgi:protein SCO1/2